MAFFHLLPRAFSHKPQGYGAKNPFSQGGQKLDFSVGSFVINLQRSMHRWQHTVGLFSRLGLEPVRVSGVDGAVLDLSDTRLVDHRVHRQVFGTNLGPGTLGCALGHHRAWRAFLTSPFDVGLICEDDIDVPDAVAFHKVLRALIRHQALWDVCSLHLNHRGAPLALCPLPEGFVLCAYRLPVTGGGCYLLSRWAAERLLAKALPVGLPIDHFFPRGWEFGLRFTGVERPATVQDRHNHHRQGRVRAVRLVYPKEGIASDIVDRGRSHPTSTKKLCVPRQTGLGVVRCVTLVATALGFWLSALGTWICAKARLDP